MTHTNVSVLKECNHINSELFPLLLMLQVRFQRNTCRLSHVLPKRIVCEGFLSLVGRLACLLICCIFYAYIFSGIIRPFFVLELFLQRISVLVRHVKSEEFVILFCFTVGNIGIFIFLFSFPW